MSVTPSQAAQAADAVFTMVADDAALAAVTYGEAGIASGCDPAQCMFR